MTTTFSSPLQERLQNMQLYCWYVWRRNRVNILAGIAGVSLVLAGLAGYWAVKANGPGQEAPASEAESPAAIQEEATPAGATAAAALAEKQQVQVLESLLLHQQDEQLAASGQLDAIQETLAQLGLTLDRYQQILARVISNQQTAARTVRPPVTDGDEDVLATLEESLGAGSVPAAGTATSGLLDLNAATVTQLDDLPGIGPAYAQRIVEYREESGPFKSVQELLNIKGIGEALFAKIEPLVTVSG